MDTMENRNECCKAGFASVDLCGILPEGREKVTPVEAVGFFSEDPAAQKSAFLLVSDFMDFDLAAVRSLESALQAVLPANCSIHILTTHNHGGEVCDKLDMTLYCELVSACAVHAVKNAQEALCRSVHVLADPDLSMIRRLELPEVEGSATCFYGIAKESCRNGGPFARTFLEGLQQGSYPYVGGDSLRKDIPYRPFPEGDRDLFGMEFVSRKTGMVLGRVIRYAAHAVCCNDGKYYSADYPYFLRDWMTKNSGGAVCMFLNGPCGEIAPGLYRKSLETARTLGETLAGTVWDALQKQPFRTFHSMEAASCTVALPVRQEILSGNFEVEEKSVDSMTLPERKKYFEALNFRGTIPFLNAKYRNGEDAGPGEKINVQLGLLRCNDTLFFCFPGETFFATGRAVCSSFPELDLVTVTEHGRTVMYLPPEEEFAKGGYETVCKLTAPHAERVLREEAVCFLENFLKLNKIV